MADTAARGRRAFRRLVKRQGGCGLVVSEMVSSEGLVRGIDRTLEFAEYMAKRAEYLIDSADTCLNKQAFVDGAARDEHRPLKVDQLDQARGDLIEAMDFNALIYQGADQLRD